jgi:hypothetical protein
VITVTTLMFKGSNSRRRVSPNIVRAAFDAL